MLLRNEGFMEFWRLLYCQILLKNKPLYDSRRHDHDVRLESLFSALGTELYPAELLNTILVVAWNILSKSGANIFILFI